MEAAIRHNWETRTTDLSGWYVRMLPSLTDFAFLAPAALLFFLLSGVHRIFSDGDTGWHIRTGEWILQHGTVPMRDLFSFTKPGEAWFAWEWGSDVLLALIHSFAGLAGVGFVTVCLLGLTSALLYRLIRRCCDNDLLALGITVAALCASMIHWLARPHLFSWIFILIFCHAILSAESGRRTLLCWLPAIMVLWTNLHGGFFIGIALVGASVVGEITGAIVDGEDVLKQSYERSLPYALVALGCLAATFVNPYGWHLHQHVIAYLRDSKLLDNIQEYQSVNFHLAFSVFLEVILLPGIAAAYWCVRREKFGAAFTVALWAHLALVSARNFPIFALVAAPWIACMVQEVIDRITLLGWCRNARDRIVEIAREFRPIERVERWHLLSGAALILLAYCFATGRPGFEGEFNPKGFPVTAIAALKAAKADRLFTVDQWADYLIYKYYPSQRVFMDGRTDFYGHKLLTEYQRIMSAQYDWEADLAKFKIDTVMVAPDTPLASVLKISGNWKVLFDDGKVILFRQACREVRREERIPGGKAGGEVSMPCQVGWLGDSQKKSLV